MIRWNWLLTLAYLLLCALLVINPLPFGSNREWAWASLAVLTSIIFIIVTLHTLLSNDYSRVLRLKKVRFELALIGCWLSVHCLYLIPFPVNVLLVISPGVGKAYAAAGLDFGYLTLDYHSSLSTLLLSVYYSMIFCLCLVLLDSRRKSHWVVMVFLSLAVFETVYGMYLVSIGQTGLFQNIITVSPDHLSGTFVNKNHVVAYLSMSFLMVLALRFYFMHKWKYRAHSKRVRVLRFVSNPVRLFDVGLVVIFSAVIATHSRAGLAALILSILVFIILYHIFQKKMQFNIKWVLLALIATLVFAVTVSEDIEFLLHSLGIFSEDSLEHLSATAEGRSLALLQVWENFTHYMPFGVGPGSYEVFFVNHRALEQVAFFDHSHNDYAEFFIEFGVFSIILLLLLISVIVRILSHLSRTKSRLHKLLGIAAISCLTYMSVHGALDFNARIPANVVTLIVAISLAYSCFLRKNKRKSR